MSLLKQFLKTDRKCLRKFIWNFGVKGSIGFQKFQTRKKKGMAFPAFQFISLTDDCNLKCQGCWVTKKDRKACHLEIETVNNIIEAGKKNNSRFFGLLGGEPLMYKQLLEIFSNHQDCYFQLFTNGLLINDEKAKALRRLGNVSPLISFEGDQDVADIRRGGKDVYAKTIRAIETCVENRLITGVAMSVCKSNIDMALSDDFVNMLVDKGVLYLWYYIYRPTGEAPTYELALEPEQIEQLRRFMVEGRKKYSIVLVDAYWNGDGEPFCPAAEGLSHHINPSGYIEPCPIIQFAADNVKNGDIIDVYNKSAFLRDFRIQINKKTKGCILMEDPKWLIDFVEKHDALNTSNRKEIIKQLKEAPVVCSHSSCAKIPEKNFMYRFAKNRAFWGLGAYG